jgi:hypothetical protein
MKDSDLTSNYTCVRYWTLHELRRVRASQRVGTQSDANARKERKALQRDLATLRCKRRP